jgi:hypothetical protein
MKILPVEPGLFSTGGRTYREMKGQTDRKDKVNEHPLQFCETLYKFYVLLSVFIMSFVFISEERAIFFLNNTLAFISEMKSVYCAVRIGSLEQFMLRILKC